MKFDDHHVFTTQHPMRDSPVVAVKQKLHFLVFIAKMLFDTDRRPSERTNKKTATAICRFCGWEIHESWTHLLRQRTTLIPLCSNVSVVVQPDTRVVTLSNEFCVMVWQPFEFAGAWSARKMCSMGNDHERIAHRHFGYSMNINISPRTEHSQKRYSRHLVAYDVHISFYRLEIVNANSFSDKFHFIKSKDTHDRQSATALEPKWKSNKYPCVYWSTFLF